MGGFSLQENFTQLFCLMPLTQQDQSTFQSKESLLEEKKLVCKKERNNMGSENLIIN
jgi:hypothetical protein